MKKIIPLLGLFILTPAFANMNTALNALEKNFDVKIGLYALDLNTHQVIAHRSNERFPTQSTYKFMGAAALLDQSAKHRISLDEIIHYTQMDLTGWQPITEQHLATGMTLEALAAASVSYSDTPAMNLISKRMGGPAFAATFANSIGNSSFNVSHYEGELNSDPNNTDDTVTPKDMALSMQKILLGHALPDPLRQKLLLWMRDNTTGDKRIRAGTPAGLIVADKTGSGDYGVANDIALIWKPHCKPIVLTIYTVRKSPDAERQDAVLAKATTLVLNEFKKKDTCLV